MSSVIIERAVPCPMRDGTVLSSDVYRPEGAERHPVLLQRTPYDKGFTSFTWLNFDPVRMADAGYVVVIQDVRGRFASGGEFREMYAAETEDGADAVEWAAAQDWSNGHVGGYGTSYMGGAAWLAAVARPPALRAIATATSPGGFLASIRRAGALQLGALTTWTLAALGPDVLRRKLAAGAATPLDFAELVADIDGLEAHLWKSPLVPFGPLDDRAGGIGPWFSRLAAEETEQERHRALSASGRHDQITAPVLQLAGWYDLLLGGDLEHFVGMRDHAATEEARDRSRLIVGPWSHGAFASTVAELDFGLRANGLALDLRGDLTALHQRWFDQRLRDIDTGIDAEPRVQLFVMGENRWKGFDNWPPPATSTSWYLQPDGGVTRGVPSAAQASSTFCLDPDNPVRSRGGALLMGAHYLRGPVEQTPTEDHPDVLVFTSPPLDEDMEVIGPVRAELWIETETLDSDVVVRLCDVHPDGRSFNVADGIQRLRFRDPQTAPEPMRPGHPELVEIDMWATAQLFRAGHRIRIHIAASDFPRYDRCPGTGENAAYAPAVLPQRNLVWHDATNASRLLLPVTS